MVEDGPEGSQYEGENTTTTDLVSKGKEWMDWLLGKGATKEVWSQRTGKMTPAVRSKLADLL